MKAEKCHFCAKEQQFLGHVVGEDGIKPDPAKIEKVLNYPVPTNIRDLREVLGLFSYYRHFIKDFSKIADPLYQLLKKDVPYEWTSEQQQAFEILKAKLTEALSFDTQILINHFFYTLMHVQQDLEQC